MVRSSMYGFIAVIVFVSLPIVNSDYLGRLCGTDWGKLAHHYPRSGSQVQECIEFCHNGTFRYAGLLDGTQCYCDNIQKYPICRDYSNETYCFSNTNCSASIGIPCKKDPTMICGSDIWYSLYDSNENYNTITHWDTKLNDVCSRNQGLNCTWSCRVVDEQYVYQHGDVWGTIKYDIGSSYCVAAAHDLRYVANEETGITISRETYIQSKPTQGSWRYGISSKWKDTRHVFTITYPPRNFDFSTSILWGFVDMRSRILSCIEYPSSTGSPTLFAATLAGKVQATAANLPLRDDTIFYCGMEHSYHRIPASYVPVVTQPSGNAKAVKNRTITVVEGDTVSFSFSTTGIVGKPPYKVMKQDRAVINASSTEEIDVTFGSATLQDAGFYRLTGTDGAIAARVRLIVVEPGTNLNICGEFRGVPREDKTCLCFPPFGNDAHCTGICNKNTLDGTFGPNCDMNCGAKNCQGFLICGENPYGCYCPSGWYGDDCATECPQGTWGPDCSHHANGCHCDDGHGCNRITGDCPFGCEWGWFTDNCAKQGPYVLTAPYIQYTGASYMQVCWKAWVKGVEPGDVGPPDGYYLNIANNHDTNYVNTTIGYVASTGISVYCENVTGLVVEVIYYFRVQTSYDHIVMPWASYNVSGSISCGTPTAPVKDLTGVPEANSIMVTWAWPDRKYWNCATTSLYCDYFCTYACGTLTDYSGFLINDTTVTSQSVTVYKYSTCNFDCYLTNGPGLNGPHATTGEVSPKITTPGLITNFEAYSAVRGLVMVWSTPLYEDGHINLYRVEIIGSGWTNTTQLHSFTFRDAVISTNYTVTIRAQNSLGWGEVFQQTVIYDIPY